MHRNFLIRLVSSAALTATALSSACGPGNTAMDGGSIAICGDGTKDPDELCDDGNSIAGDGCSPECVLSGMPYDCADLMVHDGPQQSDSVVDLLPLADGTFVAAGRLDAGADARSWLGRFEPTGAPRWFVEAPTLDPNLRRITAIAGDQQGGIWALGYTTGSLYEDTLLRLDLDGNLVSGTLIRSEADNPVRARDIEATAAGVWIGGSSGTTLALGAKDAWLGLYDPEQGTIRDLLLEDHLGFDDTINRIERHDDGVAVAATLSTSPHNEEDILLEAKTTIMVAWFDQHGNEQRRTMVGPSPDPEFVRYANQLAMDESGHWFVGGNLSPLDFTQQAQGWAAQVDGGWAWTTGMPAAYWAGMVGVDEGVMIATIHLIDDKKSNMLVYQGKLREFGLDGANRWEFDSADDIDGFTYYIHRVLARDANHRFRTIGTVFAPGQPAVMRSCSITR